MPKFKWEGLNRDGKKARGEIQASTQQEARRALRKKGIRAKRVIAPSILEFDLGEAMVNAGLAKPFTQKDLMQFTRQLATLINAGVPILQALEILYKNQKNPVLKHSVKTVASEVGEGKTIAEALSRQQGFSKLYCNLVKAGEAGGILDIILTKLAEHLDKAEKTKAQIKSAMSYPAIVLMVGIGVIWGLMTFVVPQFQGMLADTGQETPWVTQVVIDTSEFFQNYTIYMVPGFFALIIAIKAFISTPHGKTLFDKFMMKLPVFGGIIIKGNLASFSRTLATMLSSGVSLIDSLEICIDTIDNSVIAKDINFIRSQVIKGKNISEPLNRIDYFPDMVSQMITVGESTGNLDQMLLKVATVFDEEVDELIGGMTKMIEPLIIVFLGGAVAFVMIAMYLPIFMSAGGT
jgi:type IV pilus assembly protein PilC